MDWRVEVDTVIVVLCLAAFTIGVRLLGAKRPIRYRIYRRSPPVKLEVMTIGTVSLNPVFKFDNMLLTSFSWAYFTEGLEIKAQWEQRPEFLEILEDV